MKQVKLEKNRMMETEDLQECFNGKGCKRYETNKIIQGKPGELMSNILDVCFGLTMFYVSD